MRSSITEVIREMVQGSGKPAKALARELDKPYSTFMRELQSSDRNAKFGVEMLLPLMQACASIMPLRYLASRMGCRVVSLESGSPEKSSIHEELLDSYDAIAHYHRAIRSQEPLERVAELREQVIRQVQKDFVAYRQEIAAPQA
ncbi:hypothetical protein DVDV_0729 [Desulfovibrio sp. DV]|uniref:phage regulatory CII family protein n=1 Tax=Desulfovibrio sp. DV TaxID=1844708 RepID=UPI00094B9DEB|nr:phage regulatory CII family protein [Desulfovibrio sp. DV]OLN30127.1 hypothetical protein DVDV_0729 [Desulfovibrio sp. DV]